MKTIVILALNGMLDSSIAITRDTLRTAQTLQSRSDKAGGIRVLVAGYGKSVRTGGGMRLATDLTFRELASWPVLPTWLVLPGLGSSSEQEIADRLRQKDAVAAMALLRSAPGRAQIGASCTSVFLLAAGGFLSGRHVTMTWWLAAVFRNRFPDVRLDETRMLVRDGRYLTAGSAFAQLDLVLAVVADVMGAGIADLVSRYLLIEQRPSQARYMIQSHGQYSDPTVVAAERWIDLNLSEAITVPGLAAALALSPKTLSRRIVAGAGVTPLKLVQRRRLIQASYLIETTSMSIESIAGKVGYQDGTALRKIIRRAFGTAPTALRGPVIDASVAASRSG